MRILPGLVLKKCLNFNISPKYIPLNYTTFEPLYSALGLHYPAFESSGKKKFAFLQRAERQPPKSIPFCRNTERTELGSFCQNVIFLQKKVRSA